jgi:hypothetical protein
MVLRTGETAEALLPVLAGIIAMSPASTRSPTAIRKTIDNLGKRLRKKIAAAERSGDLQDFVARTFHDGSTRGERIMLSDNDRDFFLKNPNRKHRVRYATQDEINRLQIAGSLPQGNRLYAIVRSITPNYCARRFVPNSKDAGTDVDEDFADVLFDLAADGW